MRLRFATVERIGLRAGLQRRRQPVPVVPAAPDVEPAGTPGDRRGADAGLGPRLRGAERGLRAGDRLARRAATGRRGSCSTTTTCTCAAEPIRRARPHAVLSHFTHIPWPPSSIWQTIAPRIREGDRHRAARQRRGRLPDRALRPQLPAHGRVVRPRRHRRLRERDRPPRPADDPRAHLPDQHRRRCHAARGRLPRRTAPCRPAAGRRAGARHRAGRPARALEEHPARLPRLRDAPRRDQPRLRGRISFLAFLVPSRTGLREYGNYGRTVQNAVDRINARFGRAGWRPIQLFYENDYAQALAGLSIADVVLVNPLVDGMNLVAKEAVVVSERDAVLVLSETAGAYDQMARGALAVAPADVVGTADALASALAMDPDERRKRLRVLRAGVERRGHLVVAAPAAGGPRRAGRHALTDAAARGPRSIPSRRPCLPGHHGGRRRRAEPVLDRLQPVPGLARLLDGDDRRGGDGRLDGGRADRLPGERPVGPGRPAHGHGRRRGAGDRGGRRPAAVERAGGDRRVRRAVVRRPAGAAGGAGAVPGRAQRTGAPQRAVRRPVGDSDDDERAGGRARRRVGDRHRRRGGTRSGGAGHLSGDPGDHDRAPRGGPRDHRPAHRRSPAFAARTSTHAFARGARLLPRRAAARPHADGHRRSRIADGSSASCSPASSSPSGPARSSRSSTCSCRRNSASTSPRSTRCSPSPASAPWPPCSPSRVWPAGSARSPRSSSSRRRASRSSFVLGFSPILWTVVLAMAVRNSLMNAGNPIFSAFAMEHVAPTERATAGRRHERPVADRAG